MNNLIFSALNIGIYDKFIYSHVTRAYNLRVIRIYIRILL